MCGNEVSDLGFLDDLDVEHSALLAVERVHHSLERLAHPVTDLLLEIFTSESDGGNEALTAQYFGITLVQPRIVGGAQSKKGRTVASCWPFCSPVGV